MKLKAVFVGIFSRMKLFKVFILFMSLIFLPSCAEFLSTLARDMGKKHYTKKTFSLRNQGLYETVSFPVNIRGRITATAKWREDLENAKISIMDPEGQVVTSTTGASPLTVSYKISTQATKDYREWSAAVYNEGGNPINGTLTVNYPFMGEGEGETSTSSGGGEQQPPTEDYPPQDTSTTSDQGGAPPETQGGYPPQDTASSEQYPPPPSQEPYPPSGEAESAPDAGGAPAAAVGFGAHNFSITSGNRQVVNLQLTSPGVIKMKASWQGDAGQLALILNGPGQTGYYARKDGQTPLWINFKVTQALLNQGSEWQVSLVNFYSGSATGILSVGFTPSQTSVPSQIYQIGAQQQTQTAVLHAAIPRIRTGSFNYNLIGSSSGKDKEYRFNVTAPGLVKVNTTWQGNATQLTVILNGPGQVNAYARQDGRSPVNLQFNVTEQHIQKGTQWKVTIANYDQALTTASGQATISYPQR